MPSTARGLGTSTAELAKMSRTEQLKYVDKYFSNKGIEGGNLDDLYMAILFPAAVGKPDNFVLFGKGATISGYGAGSIAYRQNALLDLNKDGSVTKAEAAASARKHKGKRPRPAPFVPPSQRQPGVPGQSKVETDILEFRKFRSERFGASSERRATANPDYYQIREMGVYGSGNYNISPLADDTSYEIGVHKGAGHHENRAFDIPVPKSSAEGDAVAEFWRSKGYRTIWRSKGHFDHVHVEVPKHKADEFYRIMQKPKPKPAEVSSRASYEGRQVAMVPLPVGGGGGVTPVVVGGSSGQPQRPSESNKASLLNNYQNAQMMSTLSRTA